MQMKRFCLSLVIASSFLLFLLAIPLSGHAQLGDDFVDPDAAVPIDGGLSILLAAGIGYGVKKAHEQRKKNKSVPLL
jgi:hypothetical protein